MIKLSIIIPAFNAARTISQTLNSLQDQTMMDWEAIVVAEGTDATYGIARAFGERDDRIWAIYLGEKGGGCMGRARAVNVGINRASGMYLMNLDADDYLLPDFAEKCVAALEADTMAPGVYTDLIEWDEPNGLKRIHRCPDFDRKTLLTRNFVPFSSLVFRIVARLDPDWEPVADWDAVIRMTKYRPLVHLPEILSVRRIHSGQVSSGLGSPRMMWKRLLLPFRYAGFVPAVRAMLWRLSGAAWYVAHRRLEAFK